MWGRGVAARIRWIKPSRFWGAIFIWELAMRFSERHGFKPMRQALQIDTVDQPLLNGLWNILDECVLKNATVGMYGEYETFSFYDLLWTGFYKEREDQKPTEARALRQDVKARVFGDDWFEIYDLIEYVLAEFRFDRLHPDAASRDDFISSCNRCLEREMSGYRIVGSLITKIISEPEVQSVDLAASKDQYDSVAAHIQRALELLSDRKNPDYRNSIKESISAVESICAIIPAIPRLPLGTLSSI